MYWILCVINKLMHQRLRFQSESEISCLMIFFKQSNLYYSFKMLNMFEMTFSLPKNVAKKGQQ